MPASNGVVDLMLEHYDVAEYVPRARYFLANLRSSVSKKFPSERKYRNELHSFKPRMIANTIPFSSRPEIVIDIDLKMKVFSPVMFERASLLLDNVITQLERYLSMESYRIVFSGRGFHVKAVFSEVREIIEKLKDEGLSDNEIEIYYVRAWNLILQQLGEYEKKYLRQFRKFFGVEQLIDTIANRNRVIRTELSVNNKSYLPVVPLKDYPESIDDIIYVIREPRLYTVQTAEKVEYRMALSGEVSTGDVFTVDEYELQRLLDKHGDIIKKVIEVEKI